MLIEQVKTSEVEEMVLLYWGRRPHGLFWAGVGVDQLVRCSGSDMHDGQTNGYSVEMVDPGAHPDGPYPSSASQSGCRDKSASHHGRNILLSVTNAATDHDKRCPPPHSCDVHSTCWARAHSCLWSTLRLSCRGERRQ